MNNEISTTFTEAGIDFYDDNTEMVRYLSRIARDCAYGYKKFYHTEFVRLACNRLALINKKTQIPDIIDCPNCKGKGQTQEHSTGIYDHDGEGNCIGNCPVSVQCDTCHGTGKLACFVVVKHEN